MGINRKGPFKYYVTLGGEGVNKNSDFKAFSSQKSSLKNQDYALKDTFFLIHFIVQCLEVLENSYLKMLNVTWGQKSAQKSVTYYLNGPLS